MILLVACSFVPFLIEPTTHLADLKNPIELNKLIPKQFNGWVELENIATQIVDPELQASLSNIYSDTLSLTFESNDGEQVMLSIAYSPTQTEGKYIHYPAVCYPSAGFKIDSIVKTKLNTQYGDIPIKNMFAIANNRFEAVTYWALVGNNVVLDESDSKLQRVKYGLTGIIPDAILFRVSTLSQDKAKGFSINKKFINGLLQSLPEVRRNKLISFN